MRELTHFFNAGFGWVCRKCESELSIADDSQHSRLLREGEAEGKNPRLSNVALAKWADESRTTLECPRCGVSERVGKQ